MATAAADAPSPRAQCPARPRHNPTGRTQEPSDAAWDRRPLNVTQHAARADPKHGRAPPAFTAGPKSAASCRPGGLPVAAAKRPGIGRSLSLEARLRPADAVDRTAAVARTAAGIQQTLRR